MCQSLGHLYRIGSRLSGLNLAFLCVNQTEDIGKVNESIVESGATTIQGATSLQGMLASFAKPGFKKTMTALESVPSGMPFSYFRSARNVMASLSGRTKLSNYHLKSYMLTTWMQF